MEAAKRPTLPDIVNLLRIPEYVLVVLGYTAYTFALGAFAIWGPTFLHRAHGVAVDQADTFFGAVLVVAGLVGTLLGGFAATAWQKRNRAGYAWTLGLSVLVAVPLAFGAFIASSTFWSMTFLALAMFFLFLSTGPVNTLILETVPVNLRASAMAVSIFAIHLLGDMWSPEIVGRLADSLGGNLQRAVSDLPGGIDRGRRAVAGAGGKNEDGSPFCARVTGLFRGGHLRLKSAMIHFTGAELPESLSTAF